MTLGRARRRSRGEAGVTLVELAVSMALMGILIGIVGPTLISAMTATNRLEKTSAAVNDARLVGAQLDRDLRSALCITSPGENQSGNTLVFQTLSNGVQSTLTYRVVGSELTRQDDLAPPRLLISTVAAGSPTLAFRQIVTPLRTVKVTIPIRSLNGGEFLLETTIAGRNAWRTC